MKEEGETYPVTGINEIRAETIEHTSKQTNDHSQQRSILSLHKETHHGSQSINSKEEEKDDREETMEFDDGLGQEMVDHGEVQGCQDLSVVHRNHLPTNINTRKQGKARK